MAKSGIGSDTVWVLPDEPIPVRLMNTIWADRHGVHDALTLPADLADWLQEVGAYDYAPDVTQFDLVEARVLRDALRRLAALITGDSRQAAASATADNATAVHAVNHVAAARVPPRLELKSKTLQVGTTPLDRPVAAALADVAIEAIALFTAAAVPPLRACLAPGCVLYFLQDHPRREWCSNACGNRARAARHYERHRSANHSDRTSPGSPAVSDEAH
jgi:predicted RNA-binding Zn ribbon-like protein